MTDCEDLRFGPFELQFARRRLLSHGESLNLGARAFDVLVALAVERGRIVTKSELLDRVWPGLVVEENNLQVQVSTLRKLLGPQVIVTIPGRGYRFVASLDGPSADRANDAARDPASIDSLIARRSNLPASLAPLIGRKDEVHALGALIEAKRLVTVVGAGGIGKSRLALTVAHGLMGRWRNGVWMVELAGLADPALLPHAVAQPLGLSIRDRDGSEAALATDLASREMLLVLDNCEHLLEPVAALVDRLLQSAPGVRVLATSQEPLHLEAEQQYRINPLPIPRDTTVAGAREFGAVALLECRVRAVDPRFTLDEQNLALAIKLCRHLDGLPLAIELAAVRVPLLGLRAVHDRLDERFRLLTAGSRTALRRHQTLRAALDWSHALLNEPQRTVFRRLGVFSGGFSMELAQAVCSDAGLDEWDVLEHLGALVKKSLVVADLGEVPRYQLLESARAFALEQLAACGEIAATVQRHARALLQFLQRIDDAHMDSKMQTMEFGVRVLPELDNLRAAYAWAVSEDGDRGVAIALAAHSGYVIDYGASECIDWLLSQRSHVVPGAVPDGVAARFWRGLAAGNMLGHVPFGEMHAAMSRSAHLYQALREPRRAFSALLMVAVHCMTLHDSQGAQAAIDQAQAMLRPDWEPDLQCRILRSRDFMARWQKRMPEALALSRESVRLSAASGDWRMQVIERTYHGELLWQMGLHDEAARAFDELAEAVRLRPVADTDMALLFAMRTWLLSDMARAGAALAAALEALPYMSRAPSHSLSGCVHLFWRLGQPRVAARLLGALDERHRCGLELHLANDDRLVAEARKALAVELSADVLALEALAGAGLSRAERDVLVASTLTTMGNASMEHATPQS